MSRRTVVRTALTGLALLAWPWFPGFGQGTGGIGGTGARVAEGGGIGGTGIIGTGIIGMVTDFGSIWVNGVEVELPAATPITIEGRPAGAADLRLGQVVAARAEWSPAEQRMNATSVEVRYQVAGPVEDGRVLGQSISWPRGVAPKSGDWVAVSGLRRADGVIVASGVDPWTPGQGWLLRGALMQEDGALSVSGFRLSASDLAGIAAGGSVRAAGSWRQDGPAVTSLTADPVNPFGNAVATLTVEVVADGRGRLPAGITPPAGLQVRPNQRLVLDGIPAGTGMAARHSAAAPGLGQHGLSDGGSASQRFGADQHGKDEQGHGATATGLGATGLGGTGPSGMGLSGTGSSGTGGPAGDPGAAGNSDPHGGDPAATTTGGDPHGGDIHGGDVHGGDGRGAQDGGAPGSGIGGGSAGPGGDPGAGGVGAGGANGPGGAGGAGGGISAGGMGGNAGGGTGGGSAGSGGAGGAGGGGAGGGGASGGGAGGGGHGGGGGAGGGGGGGRGGGGRR